jgi:hypothetical protein
MPKKKAVESEKVCVCICKCFGVFRHDEWPSDIIDKLPKNLKIQILFRDKIRVFFKDS